MSYAPQQQTIVVAQQSQVVPALINAFCWPGLGQLIQGRILAAAVIFGLWVIACLSTVVLIGFLLVPLVWIIAIVDAARYNPVAAMQAGHAPASPMVAIIVGAVAALIILPVVGFMLLTVAAMLTSTERAPVAVVAPPAQVAPVIAEEQPGEIVLPPAEELKPAEPENNVSPPEPPASVEPPPPEPAPAPAPPPPEPPPSKLRTWKSAGGNFSVEAEFVSFANGKVTLRKADGSEISVDLEKLSADDNAWFEEYKRTRR